MTSVRSKLAVAAIALLAAFGYLAYAGMQKGWVYLVSVEQYVNDPQLAAQRVRLHGKVAADGFDANRAALTANFKLTAGDASLPITYRGAIPDLFQAGRDVVVEGKRDGSGVFKADVLMTKCASKYEPGSPHAQAAEKKS